RVRTAPQRVACADTFPCVRSTPRRGVARANTFSARAAKGGRTRQQVRGQMALDVIFMGTPEFSVPVLDALCAAGHRIVAVYSQPPRPAGRGMSEIKSPVQRRAEALGLPVLTPLNFKGDAERADFAARKADAAVVVAYGLLLQKAVVETPLLGCYNVHASKLPRWRGAAPIQRAIIAGDAVTAVNIM